MRIFQKGFNYSQDGPGNRLVIHLQGCNMHCPWCSNPESMAMVGKTTTDIPDEEIIEMGVAAQAVMYDGGGVTFTGGEPTLQFYSLLTVLKGLKERNVNTAIETNGTSKNLAQLFPYIDHLIMDFKHYDSQKLAQVTGRGNENVLLNLKQASELHQDVLIRIPLINGFNASVEDAKQFAKILKPLNLKVELLSYHEYGKEKWLKLGKQYSIIDGFLSAQQYNDIRQIFIDEGIRLIKT